MIVWNVWASVVSAGRMGWVTTPSIDVLPQQCLTRPTFIARVRDLRYLVASSTIASKNKITLN